MGGGGSILTVPVLVYLIGLNPVIATAYSLFIVGASSLVGVVSYYRQNLVSIKTAITFGLPSVVMVYLTRKFIIPAIPENVFSIADFTMTKHVFLMVIFAILMVVASLGMIREKREIKAGNAEELAYGKILLEGTVVGLLTGLVGAGGGFLIVPALVLFSGLPMKKAVGTSLIIISAKSLIGFTGDISNYEIDWQFLLIFTGLSVVGILLGTRLAKYVPGEKLKKSFGWFVLVMGIFIFIKELLLH